MLIAAYSKKLKLYNVVPALFLLYIIHFIFVNSSPRGYKDEKSDSLKLRELSSILKEKMQQLGQLSCENAKDGTSVNGGWCAKISHAGSKEHKTDEKLVLWLSNFLEGWFFRFGRALWSSLFWSNNHSSFRITLLKLIFSFYKYLKLCFKTKFE